MEDDIYLIDPEVTNTSSLDELLKIENSTYCLDINLRAYIRCFLSDDFHTDLNGRSEDDFCLDDVRGVYILCNPTFPLFKIPEFGVVVLCILYGLVSVLACAGNILVVYIVTVSRRMQTVTNLYIANLATSDILLAIFCIPFQFQAALLQRWDLPAILCQLCPFIQILSVNVSVWTLVGICLDRFNAIIHPLRSQQTKLKARIIISVIWGVGVTAAVPWGLAHQYQEVMDERKGGLKPFCSLRWTLHGDMSTHSWKHHFFKVYCIVLAVLEYFVPVLVMTVCYARMSWQLWNQKTPGQAEQGRDDIILQKKKKVIKMLVVVVVLFSMCWLPWQIYAITSIVYPAINSMSYINIVYICSHWLAMSNSCCNPFIYAILSEKFQREFRVRLSWLGLFGIEDYPRTQSSLFPENTDQTPRFSVHHSTSTR